MSATAERLADDVFVLTVPPADAEFALEVTRAWKAVMGERRHLIVLSEGARLSRVSAVHDYATVKATITDEDGDPLLAPGDRIEVVGFAYQGHLLMAIWRDDAGTLHDILAGAIRMEPHVEESA